MLKDDIKEIKKQNFEMKLVKRLEIFSLYINYLIFLPQRKDVRKHLLSMMKGFFIHYKNELVVLDRLQKAYMSQEEYDEIILELDELSDANFYYYDDILKDFEITLSIKDFDRVMFRKPKVQYLDENKRNELLNRIDLIENKTMSK